MLVRSRTDRAIQKNLISTIEQEMNNNMNLIETQINMGTQMNLSRIVIIHDMKRSKNHDSF